jgi:pyruvate formate lyase activating enzyme
MTIRVFQRGFNFSQDGPGNRLVYHLAGCNMRCPWCANPEGMALSGGEPETIENLLDEARRSLPMFFSGGGVTLTGGECTMQFEETRALLARLKESGINTAIETNASHPLLVELFPLVDYLLLDFKHHDADLHLRYTGQPLGPSLENLRVALLSGGDVLVRIPLIHGVNASASDADGFLHALPELRGRKLELLKYHEYGRDKWNKLGLPYVVKDGFVPQEVFEAVCRRFTEAGVHIIAT